MPKYQATLDYLKDHKKKWLITGVGGFIGSNLLEKLLKLDQSVIGIDNFSTGYKDNLKSVKNSVDKEQWENFSLIEGDIKDLEICQQGCDGVDYVHCTPFSRLNGHCAVSGLRYCGRLIA